MDEQKKSSNEAIQLSRQQMLRLLRSETTRHFWWMMSAGLFAAPMLAWAAVSGSLFPILLGAVLAFFTWSKFQEWRRLRRLVLPPLPRSEEEWTLLIRILHHEAKHPPAWEMASNWAGTAMAAAVMATVSVVILSTTSFSVRLLWVAVYVIVGMLVALSVWLRKQRSRVKEDQQRWAHVRWQDLT